MEASLSGPQIRSIHPGSATSAVRSFIASRNGILNYIALQQHGELIGTIQNACSTLRILGLSSCVRKRLASQLLAWGEHGSKAGDQAQFRMALTHAQIAEFIGAVRESVTRGLIAFKQRGLVEIHGSMLRIPSTTALRRYAEGG